MHIYICNMTTWHLLVPLQSIIMVTIKQSCSQVQKLQGTLKWWLFFAWQSYKTLVTHLRYMGLHSPGLMLRGEWVWRFNAGRGTIRLGKCDPSEDGDKGDPTLFRSCRMCDDPLAETGMKPTAPSILDRIKCGEPRAGGGGELWLTTLVAERK